MDKVHQHSSPRLSTPIPLQLQEELKITAVRRRTTLQNLVQEILEDWLKKNRNADAA